MPIEVEDVLQDIAVQRFGAVHHAHVAQMTHDDIQYTLQRIVGDVGHFVHEKFPHVMHNGAQ